MTDFFADEIAAVADIRAVGKILEVACLATGMGFAALARVTEARWVALAVRDEIGFGLVPGGELEVKTTICDAIRQSGQLIVIDHAAEDELFRDHATPRMYGFQSYISVPVVLSDGSFFGTLCAIDPKPANVSSAHTTGMFQLFAELIAMHLDARLRLSTSETNLLDERSTAESREKFIAVLGHDLRSPLASIDACARLLSKSGVNENGAKLIEHVRESVSRMSELIGNVLDFARGQLGAGIPVSPANADLGLVLHQVIAEVRLASPQADISAKIDVKRPIPCDASRLAQLFSNLLVNAVTHGAADTPIRAEAHICNGRLMIAVENEGEPIQPDLLPSLFRPFNRATVAPEQQGLGLGLYIASEIAKAHRGTLEVASDAARTRFVFSMPVGTAPASTI